MMMMMMMMMIRKKLSLDAKNKKIKKKEKKRKSGREYMMSDITAVCFYSLIDWLIDFHGMSTR